MKKVVIKCEFQSIKRDCKMLIKSGRILFFRRKLTVMHWPLLIKCLEVIFLQPSNVKTASRSAFLHCWKTESFILHCTFICYTKLLRKL